MLTRRRAITNDAAVLEHGRSADPLAARQHGVRSIDSAGLPIGAVFSDLVIEGTPTDEVATCD